MKWKGNFQIDGIPSSKLSGFSSFTLEEDIFHHSRFRLKVPSKLIEEKEGDFLVKSKDLVGKQLTVDFIADTMKNTLTSSFIGIITNVGLDRQFEGEQLVVLSGYSPTITLDSGAHCTSFLDKNLKSIANKALQDYSYETKVSPTSKENFPYTVQYFESNYTFLSRMANRLGEWFFYNGEKLILGKPGGGTSLELTFGHELKHFSFDMGIAPIRFKQFNRNYEESKDFSSSSSGGIDGLGALGKHSLSTAEKAFVTEVVSPQRVAVEKQKTMDDLIKARRAAQAAGMTWLQGESDSVEVRLGNIVNIRGSKKIDEKEDYGQYIICSASHYIDQQGNYRNNFRGYPAGIAVPPPNPVVSEPVCQAQYAIVKKNEDPDKLGRVKVQFAWQRGGELSPWLRSVNMGAGEGRGIFFVPEVGDEVLVGFEHHHPERPFIHGTVFHKDSKPTGDWSTPGNNTKAFQTKSGNSITLSDEGGKETVTITTPGGGNQIVISCDAGGQVTMSSGKTFSIATTDMTIDADTITMNAPKISINSDDFTLSSGSTIKMDTTEARINATSIKESATSIAHSAKAEYKASGAQASLSGSTMTKVGGGATTSVEGATVKLN